jgi:hypothetical protein
VWCIRFCTNLLGIQHVNVQLLCLVIAVLLRYSKISTGIADFFSPTVFKWFCFPKFCMELKHDRSFAYALQGCTHDHVSRNSYKTSSNILIKIAWSRWKLVQCYNFYQILHSQVLWTTVYWFLSYEIWGSYISAAEELVVWDIVPRWLLVTCGKCLVTVRVNKYLPIDVAQFPRRLESLVFELLLGYRWVNGHQF